MSDDPQVEQSQSTEPLPVQEPPKLSREDALLQDAAKDLDQAEEPALSRPVVAGAIRKSHKKLWIFLAAVLILAGIVFGAYFLLGKKAEAPAKKPAAKTPTAVDLASNTYTPDNVIYAFRGNEADPFTIYLRPSAGGERKEVVKAVRDEYPVATNVVGGVSGFVVGEKKLYLSRDGGKTYKLIVEIKDSTALVEAKVSGDAQRIAYTVLGNGNAENTSSSLYTVDLNGQDRKEVVKAADTALLPMGYNESKGKLAYSEGCYYCDGSRSAYKLYDLKTKKSTNLFGEISIQSLTDTLYESTISDDMSTLLYVQATVQPGVEAEAIGPKGVAPYKVQSLDLPSGRTTTLYTIGTKGEKNANGTTMIRRFRVGFMAGTNRPYFSEGKVIYTVADNKPKEVYESAQDINQILYVGDKNLILAADKNGTDFDLINYDLTAKKPTLILEGDTNTILFGVTTK